MLLASLVGCSAVAEYLGLQVRLDKIPVTPLSASPVDKRSSPVVALGPGQSARLVLTDPIQARLKECQTDQRLANDIQLLRREVLKGHLRSPCND
ncbi:MAG: hypothetical protein ACREVV_10285 [Steroidobacteraceae bacterium]